MNIKTKLTRENNQPAKNILIRFIIYTLLVFGFTSSLPVIIGYGQGDFDIFRESGAIEWVQLLVLALSAIILLLSALHKQCDARELFCILSLLAISAVIREFDSRLEQLIPIGGWKLPAICCVIAGFAIYGKRKNELFNQIACFVNTKSFSLLWCGFILAVPFAQLIGHGKFLQSLMGEDYVRNYKRVIEELLELLGYILIFIGSVETVLQQKEIPTRAAEKLTKADEYVLEKVP